MSGKPGHGGYGAPPGTAPRSKRLAMAREALRNKLEGERRIENLEAILEEMKDPACDWQRLKARADIEYKLLSKVLPDLKAVEHTGEDGGPISACLEVRFVN